MALIDDVRTCLRVTSPLTDSEVQMWIDAAIADMLRCGVKEELVDEKNMAPLAKSAVTCFVKGQYGYDNDEASRFLDSYQVMLTGLLNSKANEYLFPEESEGTNPDSSGENGGN